MNHMQYFLGLVLFALGNSILFCYGRLYRAYRFRFLKYLFLHILCFYMIVILQMGKVYIAVNEPYVFMKFFSLQIHLAGALLIMILVSYAFFALNLYEKGAPPSRKVFLYSILLLFGALTYIESIVIVFIGFQPLFLAMEYIFAAILFLFSLLLVLDKKISPHQNNRKVIRLFGWGYMAWCLLLVIHLMVPLVASYYLYLVFQTGLFLLPMIWFKVCFLKHHTLGTAFLRDHTGLDRIYNDKKITSREREIIELILQGKSNREIEQELFISIFTVKNHVRNIYAKLGVRSRTKLIQMIVDSQRLLSA